MRRRTQFARQRSRRKGEGGARLTMVCPEKAHRRGKLRLLRQRRTAGLSSNLDDLFCQLKTNRENLFIIIPLPRPLRQALCGGLFPSFQRRKDMQPQGREGAAKRKGRRAAAMRGGERRQRAHAPSATVEKNPRTGKGRQQQPRARARGGNSSPAARAKTMSSGPAQRQGRRNFRRVSKNFFVLITLFYQKP